GHSIHQVAFSPNGKTLAAARTNRKIDLWEVLTWKHTGSLEGHKESVAALAFAPDSRILFTGSFDTTVRFWDVVARKELRCLGEAKKDGSSSMPVIRCLSVSQDGKSLAAGLTDGSLVVWDTTTGRELRRWNAHNLLVTSVAFSPDGKALASASCSGGGGGGAS